MAIWFVVFVAPTGVPFVHAKMGSVEFVTNCAAFRSSKVKLEMRGAIVSLRLNKLVSSNPQCAQSRVPSAVRSTEEAELVSVPVNDAALAGDARNKTTANSSTENG